MLFFLSFFCLLLHSTVAQEIQPNREYFQLIQAGASRSLPLESADDTNIEQKRKLLRHRFASHIPSAWFGDDILPRAPGEKPFTFERRFKFMIKRVLDGDAARNMILHGVPKFNSTTYDEIKDKITQIPFYEEFFRPDWYRFIPMYAKKLTQVEHADRMVTFMFEDRSLAHCLRKEHILTYFHGRRSDLASNHEFVRELDKHVNDACILALEYPGFGVSRMKNRWGLPTEHSLKAAARTLAAYLLTRGIPQNRLTFFGYSMGTAMAIDVGLGISKYNQVIGKTDTQARLALLGLYTTMRKVIADFANNNLGIEDQSLLWVGSALAKMTMRNWYDNKKRLPYLPLPTMYIHGSKDPFIDIKLVQKLCDRQQSYCKKFVTFHGSDHGLESENEVKALAIELHEFWEHVQEQEEKRSARKKRYHGRQMQRTARLKKLHSISEASTYH